jgi:hypothetical protein
MPAAAGWAEKLAGEGTPPGAPGPERLAALSRRQESSFKGDRDDEVLRHIDKACLP